MATSRLEVNGASLRVLLDGPADGVPLVLANPAGVNADSWDPVLALLPPGYRTIRHDYRGTGHSSAGGGSDRFVFDQYADDVAGLLDSLAVDRAVIWGCAFGSRVALNFASRYPERVRLLALFDASVTTPDPPASVAGIQRARKLRTEAGVPELVRDPAWEYNTDPEIAREVFSSGIRRPQMAYLLPGVTAQTLVATGDCDPNLASSRVIADTLPVAEFATLEMTGHISILERPDLVSATFVRFADRHRPEIERGFR